MGSFFSSSNTKCTTDCTPRRLVNSNVHRMEGEGVVICDLCDKNIRIDSPRWHCNKCEESYDLCDTCFQSVDRSHHPHDDYVKL